MMNGTGLHIADPAGLAITLGFVMYVLGMAYLVQTALDEGHKWLALTVGGIALLLLGLGAANAHDHSRPGLDGWYQGLKSGKGPCCDGPGADAYSLADVDWDTKRDGDKVHYRVRLEGEWYDVPDEAVLTEPNRDGRTIVWPVRYWDGSKNTFGIRCFIPGSMT